MQALPENSTTPPPAIKIEHTHHQISPPHLPVQRTYESRTPKLTRIGGTSSKGAVKNVFCSDLNDLNEITTVVLGAGLSGRGEDTEIGEKSPRLSVGEKRGIIVIPSTSNNNNKEEENRSDKNKTNQVVTKREKKTSKDTTTTKKRFSLFGSGRTSDKTGGFPNSKVSKPLSSSSSSKRDKQMSDGGSGRLSKLSLPNLYKPNSPEFSSDASESTTSPSSPVTHQSFFKKKSSPSNSSSSSSKTSSKTGWMFQSPSFGSHSDMMMHTAQSELFLSTIGETNELPHPPSQGGAIRAVSMHDLSQSGGDFNDNQLLPVTVFCSSSSMHDVYGGSDSDATPIIERRGGEKPLLELSNITIDSLNGVPLQSNNKESTVDKMAANITPKLPHDSKVVVKKLSQDRKQSLQDVPHNDNKKTSHDMSHDSSHDSSSQDTSTDTLPKEFKRFTTSRKPVRKASFGGKESPRLVPKRSPSSVSRKTLEEVPTPPSSPKMSPLFNPRNKSSLSSPVTTPITGRRSLGQTKSTSPKTPPTQKKAMPTQKTPPTQKKATPIQKTPPTQKKATPTQKTPPSQKKVTTTQKTTPISERRASPSKIPYASPVGPRKSLDRTPSGRGRISASAVSSPKGTQTKLLQSNKSPIFNTKTTPTTDTKATRKTSDKTTNKATPISLKDTSPLSSASSTPPSSPGTPNSSRRRRVGVSAVTSPLVEDINFSDLLLKDAMPIVKKDVSLSEKTTPSKDTPLNEPADNKTSKQNTSHETTPATGSGTSSVGSLTSSTESDKPQKEVVGGAKTVIHSTQSKVTTTYVYQSCKTSTETPLTVTTPTTQTYKYVSQGVRPSKGDKKSSNENMPTKQVTDKPRPILPPLSSPTPGGKKVTNITLPVKTVLSPTTKKPPSGSTKPSSKPGTPTHTKTPTSPSNKKLTKLTTSKSTTSPNSSFRSKSESSLLASSSPKNKSPKVVKGAESPLPSATDREDQESPIPTVNILNPLNTLIAVSSPPEEANAPLSPPSVMGSLLARPFSPTSPEPDEAEFMMTTPLSPEVPIWSGQDSSDLAAKTTEDSHMTYIYRSTLLRKTSTQDSTTSMSRTSSNKSLSPRHESSKTATLSRTNSPRKASLPVVAMPTISRQSKLQGSIRKGSISSTLDRASTKRKSVTRLSVDKGGTLGRPRSASLTPHPLQESTKSLKSRGVSGSNLISGGGKTGSIRGSTKRLSATDRQASIRASKKLTTTKQRSLEATMSTSSLNIGKDKTDGQTSSTLTKKSLKPKLSADMAITKPTTSSSTSSLLSKSCGSVSLAAAAREKEVRRSIKMTQSKPPIAAATTGTLHRSSIKGGMSQPRLLSSDSRTSIRLSRRSSAGTISKGTAPNKGTLKRGAGTTGSPSHAPVTRGLSAERDDTLNIFDDISSMAQKNL